MNNLQYQKAKNEKTLSTLGNRAIGLEPINLSKCKRSSLLIDTETIGDITKGEKAVTVILEILKLSCKLLLFCNSYLICPL